MFMKYATMIHNLPIFIYLRCLTVTGNWRVIFRFEGENSLDLNLEDYH